MHLLFLVVYLYNIKYGMILIKRYLQYKQIKVKIKFILRKFCFNFIIKLIEDNNLTKDKITREI